MATFDAVAGTVAFYVNGTQQAAMSTGLRTYDGAGGFSVGSRWTGEIDDSRVHSGVIDTWGVSELYSATKHF